MLNLTKHFIKITNFQIKLYIHKNIYIMNLENVERFKKYGYKNVT